MTEKDEQRVTPPVVKREDQDRVYKATKQEVEKKGR